MHYSRGVKVRPPSTWPAACFALQLPLLLLLLLLLLLQLLLLLLRLLLLLLPPLLLLLLLLLRNDDAPDAARRRTTWAPCTRSFAPCSSERAQTALAQRKPGSICARSRVVTVDLGYTWIRAG